MRENSPWQTRQSRRAALTRRRLIQAGALGGAGMLAGCIGDDETPVDDVIVDDVDSVDVDVDLDDADTPDLDDHVEDATLRFVTPTNPEEMEFLREVGWRGADAHEEIIEDYAWSVGAAMTELPVWSRYQGNGFAQSPESHEFYGRIVEDFTVEPDTLTVELREDANWSDGEPITAWDGIGTVAYWQWPHAEHGWTPPPEEAHPLLTPNYYTLPEGPDGKVCELHRIESPEWDESNGFVDKFFWTFHWVTTSVPRFSPVGPGHVEPYKSIFEEAIEQWEDRVAYEDHLNFSDLAMKHVTPEHIEASRQGEIPVSGAWQLDEIHGTTEVALTPNEEHWAADQLNFDELVFEYSEEDARTRGALQANRIDHASVDMVEEMVDQLPDTIQHLVLPSAAGIGLGVDHHSAFGDRLVRQATLYALDKHAISRNVHATRTSPAITPGWDAWFAEDFISETWANDNLISYAQDVERAEELMAAAGWTRAGDEAWEQDGSPLAYRIATAAENPVMELTVADQLRDFGLDISVQTFDAAAFEERRSGVDDNEPKDPGSGRGEFSVWSGGWIGAPQMTGYFRETMAFWWNTHNTTGRGLRTFNFYDHETVEDLAPQYDHTGYVLGDYTVWRDLTIDFPPVGEPDGELSPFNPAYTFVSVWLGPNSPRDPQSENPHYNPPHDEPHEENEQYFYRLLAWTMNWYLGALPIALDGNQEFLNTTNWRWPPDLAGEDNQDMWQYYGEGWNAFDVAGMAKVQANPDDPK